MKVAWFTPFSIKSAIGKYSQIITEELIKYCDVDLWLAEDNNLLATDLQIIKYTSETVNAADLANYDLLFFNIGNYLYFHKEIYEISKKFKGVVILHDFVMHHFFTGYYFECKKNPMKYVTEMERLYGESGKLIAEASISGKNLPVWETDEVADFPFFEKAIEGALAVITHSFFHADKVRKQFSEPIETLYFPFRQNKKIENYDASEERKKLGIADGKLLLLTVGDVNPNKRVDKVLEALGKMKEAAEQVVYIIIGQNNHHKQYLARLRDLIDKYALHDVVKMLGYQPDDTLNAYMANADVFINLRYPATEGASWSLVEQLYFGKPIIVTDTGFYGELPSDCLIKIRPSHEDPDLSKVLETLIRDENLRARFGSNGRRYAMKNFNVEKYCQELLFFAKCLTTSRPTMKLIQKVADEFFAMGVYDDMNVVDNVSKEIYIFSRKKHT